MLFVFAISWFLIVPSLSVLSLQLYDSNVDNVNQHVFGNVVCRAEELPRWPWLFGRRRSPTCELGMFCILMS